ncbi:hypothetical protein HNO52_01070 [Billgrantia diversa]|uniref:hypothetical protein n=1 Tax=Halomonas sp. MCCC 1A13316 TaxID=2733487 RepID=UPI0018A6479E|nr:hypothetical protein [Halomonas sp. MCCC 1A13316]QOR37249.1 hypothetical protein HNO52_01070 [Halomonas sp. MCCC 1A13316]
MKHWRLVLRVVSDSEDSKDASELKRSVTLFLRVVETYEVTCLGMRIFGIDFLAEDEEFNHVMSMVKILKERYRFSIMQFGELREESETGMTIRVGSKPATHVA